MLRLPTKLLIIVGVLTLTIAFTGIISSVDAQTPTKIDLQKAQSKIINNYREATKLCSTFECRELERIKYSNQIKKQLRAYTVDKVILEW